MRYSMPPAALRWKHCWWISCDQLWLAVMCWRKWVRTMYGFAMITVGSVCVCLYSGRLKLVILEASWVNLQRWACAEWIHGVPSRQLSKCGSCWNVNHVSITSNKQSSLLGHRYSISISSQTLCQYFTSTFVPSSNTFRNKYINQSPDVL